MRLPWLLLTVTACGRFGFDEEPSGPPPDANGGVRSKLTLDRASTSEDLIDFPLLVVLDDTRFDRTAARTDLADVRFTLDDGTVLDHEFETSPDQLLAWVRVPLIASGSTPTLWLTYGDPDATARTAAVWGSSYAGVWHLDDAKDASANGNDGTASGATHVAGRIGRGADFAQGGTGHIAVADKASLHGTAVTASGWIRLRSYQQASSALITRSRVQAGIENDFFLGINAQDAHVQMTLVGRGPSLLNSPSPVPLGTWVQIALVFDGAAMVLYLDGVEANRVALVGNMASAPKPIYLGADNNTGGTGPDDDFVDGTIDEVRLEVVARSAAWIAADHASATDGWITYGAIER